jgi:hypothetical protein
MEMVPSGNSYGTGKFLGGQALFSGLSHMYAATYKETRDSLQPSIMESEQENASQTEQTNA